jgi:CRISPR-associated protein Csy2
LPQLTLLGDKEDDRAKTFKRLSRRWLPGFALVLRDDVLQAHFEKLRDTTPTATLLDAWLDLSRINHYATQGDDGTVTWQTDTRKGWLVPIPVGFAALTPTPHPAGAVAGARNPNVPFQFVESVYSIGQWISPHRLDNIQELMWRPTYDSALGLYRCVNDYKKPFDLQAAEDEYESE